MPQDCSVCVSPNLVALQRLAAQGASQSELATRFAPLSQSAIQRHLADHIPCYKATKAGSKGPSKTPGAIKQKGSRIASEGRCPQCEQIVGESAEKLSPEAIVKRAERVLYLSEKIAAKAESNDDARLALSAVDRCQRALEGLMKVAGLIGADTVVNIDNRQQNLYLEKIPTDGLRALQVMHEAFDAGKTLAEALAAVEAQQKAPAALPRPNDTNEAVN